jgi:hypothetical protein
MPPGRAAVPPDVCTVRHAPDGALAFWLREPGRGEIPTTTAVIAGVLAGASR